MHSQDASPLVRTPKFRQVVVVVNLIFLLWSAASWMRYGGLLPHWRLGDYLLIGAGSPLGVLFHFAWWFIADALLALAWVAARVTRRASVA
ncbi:MAG TPA: hypothetical protein DIT48_02750 [Actinobacteria bacterium]|nr:hypothetical protein [Actinomycetota bacterium]HCP62166.1 hypothetical protein [Actinomycetota bacterium]